MRNIIYKMLEYNIVQHESATLEETCNTDGLNTGIKNKQYKIILNKYTIVQIHPTLNKDKTVTLLLLKIMALGGVPIGNSIANEIAKATGTKIMRGECP